MRTLRSYSDQGEAELALALLRANRIDAVLVDAAPAPPGGAPQPLHLSVPADQHLQALAILDDEAESRAQVAAVPDPGAGARRLVTMFIRGLALFFVVNALLYLAAVGSALHGGSAQPAGAAPGNLRADSARMACHALLGGLLLAYAEPLALICCRRRGRKR